MEVKTVVIAEVYPVVFGWFLGATYKVCSVWFVFFVFFCFFLWTIIFVKSSSAAGRTDNGLPTPSLHLFTEHLPTTASATDTILVAKCFQ